MKQNNLTALAGLALASLLSVGACRVHAQEYSTLAKTKLPFGAKIIRVDDDRRQFRDAPYSYINNAIYAANPGDVIRVAPGIYREAIVINKPVRIEGAQVNRSAAQKNRLTSFSPSQESILVLGPNLLDLKPLEGAIVTVSAVNATLDGFTIQGVGTSDYRVGVGGTNVSTFNLLNTRIENTTVGVSFGSQSNVLFQGNAFLNNRTYTPPQNALQIEGTQLGRGISAASSDNVSLLSNVFAGNEAEGVSIGTPDAPEEEENEDPNDAVSVSRLLVSGNRFDASLSGQSSGAGIVLYNATILTMTKNTVVGGSQFGIAIEAQDGPTSTQFSTITQNSISGVAGDGLYIKDSLLKALVEKNTITNNTGNGVVLSEVGRWINAFNAFRKNTISNNGLSGVLLYFAIGNTFEGNAIFNNSNGIYVNYSQDNQIKSNTITNNVVDGIFVNAYGSGNVFTGNQVQGSGVFDIEDVSIGDDTYGTDNIYSGNKAAKTNPIELSTLKK